MIFFILIIVTNACSNDFDCFDQCNNYSCNNVECKCDIETLSNKIELTEKITLYYQLDQNMTFLVELQYCQRFALVFNYTRYNNENVSSEEFDPTSKDLVEFFWESTYDTLHVLDDLGWSSTAVLSDNYGGQGYQSWEILGYAIVNNKMRIKITRNATSNDSEDYQFTGNNTLVQLGYLIVYEKEGLLYHNYNRGVVLIELASITTISDKYEVFTNTGHSIFLFIFWGILSDIGIFFGRQLKSYPKYAKVHGMIFLFQCIITYIFVFCKIQYNKTKIQEIYYYDGKTIAHFIIGILFISLITIQLFAGMLVKNNLESINGSNKIFKIKNLHFYLGYLIYLVSKVQVAIGVHLYNPDLLTIFYGFYILLFFLKVTIEILYYYEVSLLPRRRITFRYVELDQNDMYQKLVDQINENVPRNELVRTYKNLNYIILREGIYDVSDFNHPGGQFIFEKITGKEIGRFFYGAYPIQNLKLKMHIHSLFAINYIETRYIGDYQNNKCPLLYYEEHNNLNQIDKHIWKLESYIYIREGLKMFTFSSHFFKVRQFLQGVEWFGRYFYIKPYEQGLDLTERPYSIVMCLSQDNIYRRQQLINQLKQEQQIETQTINDLTNQIHFIIKEYYWSNNISRFINQTSHKRYEITGPYGLGLELNPNSNGLHYVFCQGTGILPFLDLIDYLFRKSIVQLISQNNQDEIDNYENYSALRNNFKLVVFAAFENQNHFIGLEIIQDFLHLIKTNNLDVFQIYIYFKNQSQIDPDLQEHIIYKQFDSQFIKDQILHNKPEKIYVCGGPAFEEKISNLLFQQGIPKKIIISI